MKINEINLARCFVWTARQRHLIYRAMLGYLLISGVLMAAAANWAARNIRAGVELRSQAQAIQQRFILRHPDQSDMVTYANLLKDTLQKKTGQAASIDAGLPPAIYSTLSLLNLLADRTQIGFISKLSFEQQSKDDGLPELNFSVMIPEGLSVSGSETPQALQQWRKNPVLAREFAALTPTTTERGNIGSATGSILKYKAVFREE
jgi:hypothetical protein